MITHTRRSTDSPLFAALQSISDSHQRDFVAGECARVLVERLFSGQKHKVPGVRFSVAYAMAEGKTGGDIVDVFQCSDDRVSFGVADIAGKGRHVAAHAALIKYGLRAYYTLGISSDEVVRRLNRLYLEDCAFEKTIDSFASLFFGVVHRARRVLHYTSAGHEAAVIAHPDGTVRALEPTAPIIGVFDDSPTLFSEATVQVDPGSVLVVTTDGITEARRANGELYGMQRLRETIRRHRNKPEEAIVEALLRDAEDFAGGVRRDDIAILVNRFL